MSTLANPTWKTESLCAWTALEASRIINAIKFGRLKVSVLLKWKLNHQGASTLAKTNRDRGHKITNARITSSAGGHRVGYILSKILPRFPPRLAFLGAVIVIPSLRTHHIGPQQQMPTQVLSVDDLAKSFGNTEAVTGVSFGINEGEVFGLLGPNGAGKTTTISMICGLLKPDRGSILVNGEDFSVDPSAAQRSMGVVPQEVALYEELSAEENLVYWGKLAGLPSGAAKNRASELLEELALIDRRKDAVGTYSGGMKRRINIGCALLHEPKLLLLDEPTVGIDPQARENLLEFVRTLAKRGTGVLYTTHYLDEAETLCDRVGIIDQGHLLAEGTLAELQQRLGGDRLFVLDGDFADAEPTQWDGFSHRFRIISKRNHQLIVSSTDERHASECLRDLLDIPIQVDNAMVKKPSLNDVFLQLTGRELRE